MLKKFFAFTMAEVLVVIAVIGVTAALALPTVTNNMDEKKTVSALRKIYPELETAYQAVVEQYGKPPEWADAVDNSDSMSALLSDKMSEHLSVSTEENNRTIITKDGMRIRFTLGKISDIISSLNSTTGNGGDLPSSEVCHGPMGYIDVDINGTQKGNNEINRDYFEFYLCYEEGLVPGGETSNGPVVGNGSYATAWVIKAGNMDYLKCANQLNWNTKRTCK